MLVPGEIDIVYNQEGLAVVAVQERGPVENKVWHMAVQDSLCEPSFHCLILAQFRELAQNENYDLQLLSKAFGKRKLKLCRFFSF